MKVIVGGLYHESNTFNPFHTTTKDFVLTEGEDMLGKVKSTEVFIENGFEVIPSIYATALSSGVVEEESYQFFVNKFLHVIEREKDNIDGIWLHLHGAMTVENIGSAELHLLKEIRKIVDEHILISLTLDIHGNLDDELAEYANIIRSYRTVPHIDQGETEEITAQLLIDALKNNNKVKPAFLRIPMIISGEQALGNREPLLSIFNELYKLEEIEGISTASFFIGFAWADVEHSSASVIVVPESEDYNELAKKVCKDLSDYVLSKQSEFKFDALVLEPDQAITKALNENDKPVFISDSGDNTTGGAVGINTVLLDKVLSRTDLNGKKVCIAAILDEEAYKVCNQYNIGDQVRLNLGINYDEDSKSIKVSGVLKAKGDLMGYLGSTDDKVGEVCTVSTGDVDIVIANKGDSFITFNHFKSAGLNMDEYDVFIVKQGYLFPELSQISKLDILAITPGATYQNLQGLNYSKVQRPIFPLDQ